MNKHRAALALFLAYALSACTTTLNVLRIEDQPKSVPEGIVYYLPARAFNVALAFEFQGCAGRAGKTVLPYILSATVSDLVVADQQEAYVIQYKHLTAVTKVTDIDIALWDNGVLKSVNAQIDDRSAQVITSTVESLGSLARVAGLAFMDAGATERGFCKDEFEKNLVKVKEAKKMVADAAAQDEQRTEAAAALKKESATIATLKAELEKLPKNSPQLKELQGKLKKAEATKKALEKAIEDLGDSTIDAAKRELAQAKAAVTATVTRTWVPNLNQLSDPVIVPDTYLATILEKKGLDNLDARPRGELLINTFGPLAAKKGSTELAPRERKPSESAGIVFRQPIHAELLVCKGSCGKTGAVLTGEILSRQLYSMPQLGVVGSLPLKNAPFDSNKLVLAQLQDGTLTSVKFSSAAQAERAAVAAKDSSAKFLETVKGVIGDRREERAARREEESADRKQRSEQRDERLDIAKDRTESVKLLRDLEKERAGFVDRQQLQIDRNVKEVELVQSEIDLIKKRRERDEALQK